MNRSEPNYFDGEIAHVRCLEVPLSEMEITSDFNNPNLAKRWTPANDHVVVNWINRKVWINGKLVYHDPHGRATIPPGFYSVKYTIKAESMDEVKAILWKSFGPIECIVDGQLEVLGAIVQSSEQKVIK